MGSAGTYSIISLNTAKRKNIQIDTIIRMITITIMRTIRNKKVKKLATNKRTERDMNIELNKMTTPILRKFEQGDLLMALTLALSSKLILPKDVDKTIRRLLDDKQSPKSAERSMRNAFEMSKKFLEFITAVYIQKEKDRSILSY